MVEAINDELERHSLIRAVRQQLESLARAGLDGVPGASRAQAANTLTPRTVRRPPISPPVARPIDPAKTVPGGTTVDARPESPPAAPPPVVPSLPPAAASPVVPSLPLVVPITSSPPDVPVPSLVELFASTKFDTPPVPGCDRPALLGALAAEVAVCRRCPHLAETRTQTVFGVGNPETRLLFIGEAPGADEDRIGEPFVGRAGQLLTDMITKGMGLSRDQVFIANILKCRPPENRNPTIEESNNCFPYLEQQIAIIRPEFICLLGKVAAQAILNSVQPIGKLRKKWHRYRGIATLATYHPSYLLRTPSAKKDAWEDLQMLMKEMGLVRPGGRA